MSCVRSLLIFAVAIVALSAARRADCQSRSLAVLPRRVELVGQHASQRLLAEWVESGEYVGSPAEPVQWQTSDASVAEVVQGTVYPRGNGRATIRAVLGDQHDEIEVIVRGMEEPDAWSFRHDVLAVLAKCGCNSGACHGALAGKGGFKLSLRGYDPEADWFAITRQARGRRIELSDPGRSLILAKPSGAIPHKGGLRFEPDSLEYRVLAEWISSGAPGPRPDDPQLERLEILPDRSRLRVGQRQQLLVRAYYSDGRVKDVTRWAKFNSANEAVAVVDEAGQLQVVGPGEGAITAWFSSQIVNARVSVPFPYAVSPEVYAQAPRRNFIDELVLKQLARLNLEPSPRASDEEFIRRAFIDTIGTLPTAEEVREFLADTSADKRDRLIESLLARREFVDYWTYKWSDVLLINGQFLRPQAVKAYYHWVRGHVAANTPWDVMVRELITAQGSSFENGATNFYAIHQDPESMTENVCQAFLGLSIGCARCHNHPLEKWTNDQYYAMANLFARVRAKGWGGDARSGDGLRTVFVVDKGDLIQPRTGKPQPPTPLDGEPIPADDPGDRRVHLARWLTSPDNPYFARSITNRIWANYFGVGLVEPVDDMRESNPASNEELLSAAAQFLIDNGFDLKALMRVILQSETYQRSSEPLPTNRDENRFYSRYYPRRMMAEVLLDAVSQVTDVPTDFTEIAFAGADRQKIDFYPMGTRAIQLYDAAVPNYFLKAFGRNERMITCECERSDEPSMVQVLHLCNGDTLNHKLQKQGNRIDQLLASGLPNYRIIEQAFLMTLARYPTDAEMQGLLAQLNAADSRREVLEDMFWAIMTSREFLFNH